MSRLRSVGDAEHRWPSLVGDPLERSVEPVEWSVRPFGEQITARKPQGRSVADRVDDCRHDHEQSRPPKRAALAKESDRPASLSFAHARILPVPKRGREGDFARLTSEHSARQRLRFVLILTEWLD
jgi:hypothetical protein